MGEIGIQRDEYLYDLTFTDLLLIEQGYERRQRHLWGAHRWSTYHMLAAFVGGDKLAEKGIHSPQDLMRFPWEREECPLTDDEIRELQDEIASYNNLL